MQVTLLNCTPNPELTIAAAGRTSAASSNPAELYRVITPEQIGKTLKQLLASGHLSVFEHASFTFAIWGVSRVTTHQLVRHRMASYTQQSQRYVSSKGFGYVTPPSISVRPELLAKYRQAMLNAHQLYSEMVETGIPFEDARYILPQCAETQLVMTMNGRELLHAASLRLCLRAQWEIIQLFGAIKSEVEKVAPFLGGELKPKCYALGYCDEKESCGIFPTKAEVVVQ